MGTKHHAKCLDCLHQFVLMMGGGMSWYQKVCNTCGLCLNIPRLGPAGFNATMNREQLIQHLGDCKDWSRQGGKFEPSERAIIDELTGTCGCGGKMLPEWDKDVSYRCPTCRGNSLSLSDSGILYD